MLSLFAALVAASTALLILAGGFVTSTGSGLSVPDWPNTYGWFMFAFPLDNMVGGIFYEHSHRLIASTVGFLIVVLATWLWRVEPRRWVRRLGFIALAAVITQGILGGITVLWFLPDPISIAHASLAQIVFCLTVTIALVTAPGWKRGYAHDAPHAAPHTAPHDAAPTPDDGVLRALAIVTTAAVFVQIVLGATMRHTGAGLAIPDFPLAFGRLVPSAWDAKIAVHYAHRAGAGVVSLLILAMAGHVFYHHGRRGELRRHSILLLALLAVQITLGAFNVWSGLHFVINSLHVVTGGSVLVTALAITLRAHRARFGMDAGSAPRNPAYRDRVAGSAARNPAYRANT